MAPVLANLRSGNLKRRILSSLVLAPIALAAVWFGGLAFLAFLIIVLTGAAIEWRRMCGDCGYIGDALFFGGGPVLLFVAYGWGLPVAWAGTVFLSMLCFALATGGLKRQIWRFAGVYYLVVPSLAINRGFQLPHILS